MIAFLASTVLAAIVGMFIRAHFLTVAKQVVRSWVWLYTALAPKEDRDGRRAEVLSHIYELIYTHQKAGYAPGEIAVRIFEDCMRGAVDDLVWCATFIPERLADKAKGWSDALLHFRIPTALIAGVAVLGPMNYSFLSHHSTLTVPNWLLVNGIGIAMTILMWKMKNPLASRIFYSWLRVSVIGVIIMMTWLTINYHLYEIMTFKILILAMISILPAIKVVDKSWRQRLFKGRWWLITICWTPFIASSFIGSLLIAHDVKPLLYMWATMALLAVVMIIGWVAIGFVAYLLCWLGIKGSAGGLRLAAAGIRRLQLGEKQ